jgi:hypothetical protein
MQNTSFVMGVSDCRLEPNEQLKYADIKLQPVRWCPPCIIPASW